MTERHDRRSIMISKAVLIVMIMFSMGIVASIITWYLPKDVISLELRTRDVSYTLSDDEIVLYATTIRYENSKSTYETTLDCGENGRFFIVRFEATTLPSLEPTEEIVRIPIPEGIRVPTECDVEVQAQHDIAVLPYANRTFFSEYRSNKFTIKE